MELLPWYVYALSGAFVVAVAAVLEKKILEKEEPVHFSFAVTLVGGLLSLPFPWLVFPALRSSRRRLAARVANLDLLRRRTCRSRVLCPAYDDRASWLLPADGDSP